MRLPTYSRVRVLSTRYREHGIEPGMIGYVVEVYADGYEIEISDPAGNTIALCAVRASDVEPAESCCQ